MMNHVLVTGAAGFIGRNLVHSLLDSGVAVTALLRKPDNWASEKPSALTLQGGDIRDLEAMRTAVNSVDGVFHLAGATTSTSLAKSRDVNLGGMKTLIEAVRSRANPPKVVFVSSLAVAGPAANLGVTEDMECRPVSNYGKTKLDAEHLLRTAHQELPATIVRPPCVFGPWDQNLLLLFRSVRRGWNVCAGSAQYRYSFLFVRDLVRGLLAAFHHGQVVKGVEDQTNRGIYYLAHPNPASFEQMADWIRPFFNRQKVRTVELPLALCGMVALLAEGWGRLSGRLPFINLDKLRDARVGSWICHADRAAAELQFRAGEDLDDQLRQSFEWYRAKGWLT